MIWNITFLCLALNIRLMQVVPLVYSLFANNSKDVINKHICLFNFVCTKTHDKGRYIDFETLEIVQGHTQRLKWERPFSNNFMLSHR